MLDFLKQEVKPGDYFAYPTVVGRSASMNVFQFVEVNASGNVKARRIEGGAFGYRQDYRFKKFIYVPGGESMWVDMTPEEKQKVLNKTSTLLNFFSASPSTT